MTQLTEQQLTEQQPAGQQPTEHPNGIPRPHTDADALRAIDHVKHDLHQRIEQIIADPADHKPKLVLSDHVRGTSPLDRIADGVNRVCGSMWVFLGILHGQDRVLAILSAVVKPALRSPTESLAPLIVAIKQLPAMLVKRGDDDGRAGSG
jgi:hypothetical protein